MADESPTPIVDKRTRPRIAIPPRLQAWVVGGGAVLAILVFVISNPATSARVKDAVIPAPSTAQPLSQERILNEKKRLLAMADRLQAQDQAKQPDTPGLLDLAPPHGGGSSGHGTDQRQSDRERRVEDSLFASNIVATRRTGESRPIGTTTDARGATRDRISDRSAGSTPSLDETAEAVLRASQRTGQGMALPGLPGVPPDPPGVTSPASGTSAAPTTRTPPITSNGPLHRLLEGTVIDAVLKNRLDGSSASPVDALVTNPIYSHHLDHVLIPAGARVLGETKPVQNFGETRLAVVFKRLLFPDGSTVSLEQYKGLNITGDSGLHDKVDRHYLSTFGASAAVGLISGLSQAIGTRGLSGGGNNRTVVIAGDVGNATNQAGNQVMNRFLNRLPTITIREGTRLKVYITSDLDLPAYPSKEQAHD